MSSFFPGFFSFQIGGDPVDQSSIIPKKSRLSGRGIRFANRKTTGDYTCFSADHTRVNSTVNVLSDPSDKKSLSGVIGNRFANRRPLIPKDGFFVDLNPPFSGSPVPPVGFLFRSPTPIPTGVNGPLGLNRTYTIPFPFPSDAQDLVLSGTNRTYTATIADVTSSIVVYTSDGTGNPQLPSLLDFTLNLPGLGNFNAQSLGNPTRGVDNKLVFLYSWPDPTYGFASNCDLGNYTESTLIVDPPPAITGPNPNPNFWFTFEYKTSKRKIVVLGDSIAGGYTTNSSVGFLSSSWNLLQAQEDFAVSIQSVVQYGSLLNFSDFIGLPYLWDTIEDILSGSDVVLQLGTNDLNYNNLATMQSSLQNLIAHLQSFDCGNIYAWTIPPQAGYPGTEVARTGYNSWLKANYVSLGLVGVYDAAANFTQGGLAELFDSTLLKFSFDSGDATHPNLAGHVQIMNGWLAVIL